MSSGEAKSLTALADEAVEKVLHATQTKSNRYGARRRSIRNTLGVFRQELEKRGFSAEERTRLARDVLDMAALRAAADDNDD